ncbi:DUF975 family protein [Clostridium sp. ZS2-4]|nr:DUF975 family protein [Clostridium sp. ZS2-4]
MEKTGKNIRSLKKQALQRLRGNWMAAILAYIVVLLLNGIFSYVSSMSNIFAFILRGNYTSQSSWKQLAQGTATTTILSNVGLLVNLLIGGVVTYGIYRFFLNLIRKNNPQIENVFSGFKHFVKNFLLQLIIMIFTFLWGIVVYIPAVILITIISISSSSGASISLLEVLGVILAVIILIGCAVIIYIITARYSMAFFILNDNQNLSAMECIEASKTMMEGHKKRYFLMNLSFIGWDILSIFTLGIAYLGVIPYKYATRASFYVDLIGEEKSKKIDMENKVNIPNETWGIKDEFTEK